MEGEDRVEGGACVRIGGIHHLSISRENINFRAFLLLFRITFLLFPFRIVSLL